MRSADRPHRDAHEANAIQGQLLRCVKALGAFDVQLLQLCPEITGQGLAALQAIRSELVLHLEFSKGIHRHREVRRNIQLVWIYAQMYDTYLRYTMYTLI